MTGDWELVGSLPLVPPPPPPLVRALAMDSERRSGGPELGDRRRSGTQPGAARIWTSLRVGGPEVGTGKRRCPARPSPGRVDPAGSGGGGEQRAGPLGRRGSGAPDLPSPPGLRFPPRAFPGLRRPDGIKVRYPLPAPPVPGQAWRALIPLAAPLRATGRALGRGSSPLTPTRALTFPHPPGTHSLRSRGAAP